MQNGPPVGGPSLSLVSVAGSAVAELRGALFLEGRHAFLLIFRREERMEQAALKHHTVGQAYSIP